MPIDSLIPNPGNPKHHPDGQRRMLAASIRRYGQPEPVLVRAANRMLIAGHGVWASMREAGARSIVADFWEVDQATADEYMLAANRLAELGVSEAGSMLDILRRMDPEAWEAVGFTPDDVEALDPQAGLHGEPEIDEIPTDDLELDFVIVARGPIRRQPETLQRLQQLLAEYPEVTVRLMTEEAEFV